MYQLSTLVAIFAFTAVNAVPLNINLGAYSPALVVGDGEISFGTGADVNGLMSSLQGAAVPSGAAKAVAAASTPAAAGVATGGKEVVAATAPAPVAVAVPASAPATGDQQAPVAQQQVDPSPSTPSPTLQSGLGLGPDKKFILPRDPEPEAEAEPEARPGMENAVQILKRDVAAINQGKPVESTLTARDLAGFQAALNFATAAMKVSPPVELGTGEGGSGVGIKQGSGASGSVAAAAAAKAGKRGLTAIKVISKRDTPEPG